MKNLILLFSLFSLMLVSCDNVDASVESPDMVVVESKSIEKEVVIENCSEIIPVCALCTKFSELESIFGGGTRLKTTIYNDWISITIGGNLPEDTILIETKSNTTGSARSFDFVVANDYSNEELSIVQQANE
ncbi:MAG: hypothetical protein IMY73_05605 [Bacteroidetes bacterium]|nr:hypothetical protein [Bacteroidota bacterium]